MGEDRGKNGCIGRTLGDVGECWVLWVSVGCCG